MDYSKDPKRPNSGHNSALAPFPCLNSYISTENTQNDTQDQSGGQDMPPMIGLSTQHRRTAFILLQSVEQIADKYGLENLGFLTLTFAQHILCPKEAQRRLNSLITHVIKPRYHDYLGVFERQKSGRIHYHLLVALSDDIRTGFDFSGIENHDYSSASGYLRSEWFFWRKTAPKYGFGRTELMPIKSTTEAIGKYVGKYIGKHIEVRKDEDKGVRLVRYSRGARAGTTRFQFHSDGSVQWRKKVAIFAQIVQDKHPEVKISELSDLGKVLGKRWAYNHRDYILNLPTE